MKFRHFLFWLPMIGLAFINAAVRELFLVKHFNYLEAQQLSTLILTVMCGIYIWSVLPSLFIQDKTQSFQLGAFWVLLTILFEFTLGILLNRTWQSLLFEYDVTSGKTWPLFLLTLFFLPYIVFTSNRRSDR